MTIYSRFIIIFFTSIIFFVCPLLVFSQNEHTEFFLLSPSPDSITVAKTPKIVFRSSQNLHDEGLLVLLDGDDITALIENKNGVYSYKPYSPLFAGEHQLYIAGYGDDGTSLEKEFFFSTRHSEAFEELYSDNRVSATFKTSSYSSSFSGTDFTSDSDSDSSFPNTTFDAYITSDSNTREGGWDSSFKANVRYYEQDTALEEPERTGLSLLDFLLTTNYQKGVVAANAEIGDTTIEQSPNTIDYLTRRGGQASLTVKNFTISGFGVLDNESGYDWEGMGLEFNANNNIMGTSAKVEMFDSQLALKVIYANGGEEGNSLGTWSASEGRKGDVAGIVLTSDFFGEKVKSDFEFNTANYDFDTVDEKEKVSDIAYRLRFHGNTEKSDYELSYKYSGPQYEVIGNNSVVNDWAGFDFFGGYRLDDHGMRLLVNYSWDNVENDDFFGRIYSLTSGVDYQYVGWEKVPVSILIEYNQQQSADEPLDTEETSMNTGTLTGNIGYLEGIWSIDMSSSFSQQDDQSLNNYDSQLFSFSVVPALNHNYFSITPSWSYNSSKDVAFDVKTDTHTLTLDLYSSFFDDRVTCELGGTYDWTKTDDEMTDMNNSSAYARLNYNIHKLWRLENSTIAVEYTYNRQEDKVYEQKDSENLVTFVISSSIPYSL